MNTIYWHDYETTGTSPSLDRPLQFAGIRTTEDLTVVGDPLCIYCKPPRDILPHPEACLITGITPQAANQQGLSEPEFIAAIHSELAQPGTCGAGYNSIRFDDEVTRYTLYRNFFDPYEREWQGDNSRWDIIDMLRLTHALRPEGIEWPKGEEGFTSFRLENLTAANGIGHESAHDALSDVYATIAMARLVREKQPKLYDYVFQHRRKQAVAGLIDLPRRKPFLHVSSKLPRENSYTALMVPLCQHPTNKNAVICFNLSTNPEVLLQSSAEQVSERVFTSQEQLPDGVERIPLKAVHLNRCPVVATPKLLDVKSAKRLGIDLGACERHWQQLQGAKVEEKLQKVFSGSLNTPDSDAETALYQGFLPPADKPLLSKVRHAAPDELATLQARFSDKRYRELLFRYRARYFPGVLTGEERAVWEEQRYQMLAEAVPGRLNFEAYFECLERLQMAHEGDAKQLKIIDALRAWGDILLSEG